jgi:exodeoxyribonuclease III
MTFRLMTYNIRLGGKGRGEQIARIINACAPDLVLIQEGTRPALIAQIAADTGMSQWHAFRRQSLGFMSRKPVSHASWHRPRFSHHAFIEVLPAEIPVRFFGVHLSAVHAALTERRRLYELRALLRSVQQREHGFHVLAGDFNTLAPGANLDIQKLPLRLRPFVWASGGRIKWRTVQTVLDAGYVDLFRELHPEDPGFTMPSASPHLRLDYAFVPRQFAGGVTACEIVRHPEAPAASDHFPLVVDLAA